MTGVFVREVSLLACPACGGALVFHGQEREGRVFYGVLRCGGCGEAWKVERGLARLYREDAVRGTDRLMRVIYDGLPALHDPLTTVLTPLLQSVTEARMRDGYMRRLELAALTLARTGSRCGCWRWGWARGRTCRSSGGSWRTGWTWRCGAWT
ncbi:hypothetical protein ACLESD_46095 [Pyxidicoccus sp. 3LFB2]